MSFLDRIEACASFDPMAYAPFMVDGVEVGLIGRGFADVLGEFPDVFRIARGNQICGWIHRLNGDVLRPQCSDFVKPILNA